MPENWRTIGNVTPQLLYDVLKAAGSPLAKIAGDVWDASSPHSALCLAMLRVESRFGTAFNANKAENRNYLNLRPESGAGYLAFQTPIAGIRAWRERITSPSYKNGIYAKTVTIEDLIHVFAPSSDNNNEAQYVASIKADLKAWGVTPKETPMAITYGRVPYPSTVKSYLSASNPFVQESGAPAIPDAVFWHRMIGTLKGTDGWFHMGKAATAYGVGVAATDGAALAGVIYEWLKPGTGWYGESSGPAKNPYGDGTIFINEVGVNSVNRRSKSIEISGDYGTPLDDRARDAIANMTAYWADQKHIPWEMFPIVPGTARSFVIWHNEITGLAYKECPGSVVMQETSALIDRTRQVMRSFQESTSPPIEPTPPTEPTAEPFPGFAHGLEHRTDKHVGSTTYSYLDRLWTILPDATATRYAAPDRTGSVLERRHGGEKVRSAFLVRLLDTRDNATRIDWLVDPDGGWWPYNVFDQQISIPIKRRRRT